MKLKPLSKITKIIIILLFIASVMAFAFSVTSNIGTVTHVERVFVDVDGDGKVDLLVKGDVIFNQPNLQSAQLVP